MLSCNLFQQFTDIQAAKAQIVTCKEVIDEEDESYSKYGTQAD